MRKSSFMRCALALTAVVAIPALPGVAAAQQSYYVTLSGRGSANGLSSANAWSLTQFRNVANWSATESASQIDPGDTVYLCGTFTLPVGANDIRPRGSGTLAAPITIRGDCPNEPVLINGNSNGSGVHVEGRSHLVLSNLRFLDSDIYVEIRVRNSDHITIQNSTIETSRNKAIETSGSGDHLYIQDNVIRCTETGGTGGNDGIAIWVNDGGYWHHVFVRRNRISDFTHGQVNVLGASSQSVLDEVDHVYIYENELSAPNRGYARAFGFNESSDIFFFRNYVHDMRTRSQISASNVYVYNNVFANTRNCCTFGTEAGCQEAYPGCGDSDSNQYKTGQALDVSPYSGGVAENVNIVNNIILHAAESGLRVMNSHGPVPNLRVVNNAIANTSNANTPAFDPPGSSLEWADYSVAVHNPTVTNLVFTHNLINSSRSADIRYGRNEDPLTIAQWNALSGVTADANVANNPGISGYVPASATSPLVNTGTALTGPTDPELPPNSSYAHALHPSTTWPGGVVIANQNNFGSGWERGAFVYDPEQLDSAAANGESPGSSSAALEDAEANEGTASESVGACNMTAPGTTRTLPLLSVLGLAAFALGRRRRRTVSRA